jgi:tetratricopeptide (TPR) repeat protein
MKFTVTFEISPPGVFGLPEKGVTVIPPMEGGWKGDIFHTPSMRAGKFIKAGHGTLPKYREDSKRISLPIELGKVKGNVVDNFIFLEIDTDDHYKALLSTQDALNVFLQHVSVNNGTLFRSTPLIIETDDGRTYPIPGKVRMGAYKVYNLEKLAENIKTAQKFSQMRDARLQKALNYYEHALWLYDNSTQLEIITSRHYTYLISTIFLNLWKSITTIVGDPTRSKDGYQKRYKEIGLNEEDKADIDKLKRLRDDYDVAHYTLTEDFFEDVRKNFGIALKTCARVIWVFREHLLDSSKR